MSKYVKYKIGSIHKNNKNEEYEILDRNGDRFDVRFLGNDIIKNVTRSSLSSGKVANPNYNSIIKWDYVYTNIYGEDFIIVKTTKDDRYLIKFLIDNSIQDCNFKSIKNKTVKRKTGAINRIGGIIKTTEGYDVKILEYIKKDKKYKVMFVDNENITLCVNLYNLRKGNIKNPYHPTVFNIGYLGVGEYKASENGKDLKSYSAWHSMFHRCLKRINYKNVSVCEEWYNYQNFAKWYNENYPQDIKGINFHLDKDLLQLNKENKIYSPDTCVFLPDKVNSFLANKMSINTSGHTGLRKVGIKCRWSVYINIFNVNKVQKVCLGTFDTFEEAKSIYEKERYSNSIKVKDYLRSLNYLSEDIIQLIC